MQKLRVAIVIPTHYDINSSLSSLIKAYRHIIKTRNVEVTIFTDKKNNVSYKDFRIEKINGLDYKTVFTKVLFLLGIPRFYYTDLIGRLKGYDVIESSNPEFYMFAYQSYKAAKKYNARLIFRTSQTVEGFFLYKLTKFIVNPIVRKSYDYAKWLLFTNPQAAERCKNLGLIDKNAKKLIVTGHAVDTKTFKPEKAKKDARTKSGINSIDAKKTILLSVGGLYKIKGHHLIIRALKKIVDKGYNAELWIVGDGYYKDYLMKLAKELDISDKVKFLGRKSHEELAKIYNGSDIFVLANYQEITPAVNEALACKVPVVVMECGGREFIIPDKTHGMVSRKFDIDDMAEKIEYLIKNKKEARKMAEKGYKHVTKNFSVQNVANKIYKALVG
ncbi:glycosyltransferase family 4 protein [Candidatus Woesearchaeota archaeon]|nr:glycosyltransferase family 4 protein [Candidatus Woesearchaeota archaeon]